MLSTTFMELYMEKLFGTCAPIEDARRTAVRRNVFFTLLMFLAVYYIAALFSSFLLLVPEFVYLLGNPELRAAMASPDASYDALSVLILGALMKMPDWLTLCTLFATMGTIFASIIFCKKFESRSLFSMGFVKKDCLKEYAGGLLFGFLMLTAVFCLALLSGDIEFHGVNKDVSPAMLLLFFFGFLVQGLSEEVLVRGYFMVSLANVQKTSVAVTASSLVFALLHLGNNHISVVGFLNLFLFGVLAAVWFLRRGNIWAISAVHSIWNFAQGNIFGCAVSGTNAGPTLFFSSPASTNGIFGGGAFGLEGGICASIVLCAAIALMLFSKQKNVEPPAFGKAKKPFWKKFTNADFS